MKIYLDDERPAPEGWLLVKTAAKMIDLLEKEKVNIEEISLDHDLGESVNGTGYDVLLWIEEQVAINGYKTPQINIHTANSSARIKMEHAVKKIMFISNSKSI